MSEPMPPSREEIIALLATFGDRSADEVAEQIGSLELTWLITKVELNYNVTLDLTDEALSQMTTVSGAVAELREVLAGVEHV
jgi:acyl carrier protein